MDNGFDLVLSFFQDIEKGICLFSCSWSYTCWMVKLDIPDLWKVEVSDLSESLPALCLDETPQDSFYRLVNFISLVFAFLIPLTMEQRPSPLY